MPSKPGSGRRYLSRRRVQRGYGRPGAESKVPFVAAVLLSNDGRPLRTQLMLVSDFSFKAIEQWARSCRGPRLHRALRRTGLLHCDNRGWMSTSTNRDRWTQAQGLARVPVGQHGPGQSRDPLGRALSCLQLPQVGGPAPRRIRLLLQPPIRTVHAACATPRGDRALHATPPAGDSGWLGLIANN